MISDADRDKALEVLRQYEEQATHIIRDNAGDDCPTKEFEPGEPSGPCETDGHYMCAECKHCDIEYFNKLK